jgi:hypothetical protein
MKGDKKLWSILNDKLDNLRASNRLPQAIRVAETALEVAKRGFPGASMQLATSFDKLGQLLDQKGDLSSVPHADWRFCAITSANPKKRLAFTRKPSQLAPNFRIYLIPTSARC